MLFIYIAILTLVLVLALVVLVKKEKKNTDYFLFGTILSIGLYVASNIWVRESMNRHSFALNSIAPYLSFFPILFYGLLLVSKSHKIKRQWWIYTLFHCIYIVFILGEMYLWGNNSDTYVQSRYYSPPFIYHVFYKGLMIYTIVIMIWFLGRLKEYQADIKNYYSNIEAIDLNWLKHFAYLYIAVHFTAITTHLLNNFGVIVNGETPFILIAIALLLSMFYMIYNGLRQFSMANFSEPEVISEAPKKYATSSLTTADSVQLFDSIKELFEKDQVYHDPDLKVQDLAQKLGVTNHNISQSLNEAADMSFYNFVNEYRLKDFQQLLADPEKRKFTILALGMESGFNSKASINRIFKKQLGETPKEYQQRMLA